MLIIIVTGTALAVVTAAPAAAEAASASTDPVARLKATQNGALESSPKLRAQRAELRGAAAQSRVEAAAGSPYLEWQSEGLGGSDRKPNAADYVRVGTPFNLPGQIGRARNLARSAESWQLTAQRTVSIGVVAEASRRWIALAAATELEALSSARMERLEAALSLQRQRFELGEIAGSAVRQIDLERVTESSRLAELRSRRVAAEAALVELCGDRWLEVREGDLAALVAASITPSLDGGAAERLAEGPVVSRIESEAELAQANAELVAATAWGRGAVEAEWERIPSLEGVPSFDAWGFTVTVPLPIGAAGHRQREQARARADQADAELEATRRRVRRAAEEAYADAESASARLAELEPALEDLPLVDRSLGEQFRLGAISYLAYIDGLSRFDRVVEQTINARLSLLEARLELAAMLGDGTVFPMIDPDSAEED